MFKSLLTLSVVLVCLWPAMGQQFIDFTVNDSDNRPLPGATVFIKELDKVFLTDDKGQATLQTGLKQLSLYVTYIGFDPLDTIVLVSGISNFKLSLKERTFSFDAVELIGTWARDKTPMTFNNYSREYIEKNNQGQDIPFVLQWTPSVVATSDAGAGIGYTGISIRGSDPTRINVTVNGVPLNDSESQGVFWVNMPDFASSTDNIQIQRGAGSSTNGAGAFGATINLSTQQIERDPYATVTAGVGSFNTRRANVKVGTGLIDGKFSIDARYSKIDSDGYVDRAFSDLESFMVTAAYLGNKSSLKFNIISGREITYQAWNGLPQQFINDPDLRTFNTTGSKNDGTFYDNQVDNYRQTHYQLIHQYNPLPNLFTNFTLHYTRGFGFFEEFRNRDRLSNYNIDPIVIGNETITRSDLVRRRWLDNDFYGGIFSLDYNTPSQKDQFTLGISYNEYYGDHFGELIWARFAGDTEKGDQYYFNASRKTDFNIFLKYIRDINNNLSGYLDLQYRNINYTYAGDNNQGWVFDGVADFSFFNPKAGLFYRTDNNDEWYASVSTAAREPNRRDFVNTSENNDPQPEFMYNPEAGYRTSGSFYNLAVNGYLMYYRDQLVVTGEINDVGAAIRTNIPTSYRAGIEFEGSLKLGPVHLGTAVTVSRNRVLEFTEFIDDWDTGGQIAVEHSNTNLALSPEFIGNFIAEYHFESFTWGRYKLKPDVQLLTKYVGQQYLDNTSSPHAILDAYNFTDLRINIPIEVKGSRKLTLAIWVNNLFSQEYITNGWIYRFDSAGYNPLPDDPYSAREGGSRYNLMGLFPQALRNYLMNITFHF